MSLNFGKKVYPYKKGQKIVVRSGTGTQLAEVVEDCGHKFAFGSANWDYVRAVKYLQRSKRWTKIVRIDREDILGLAE